jgi:aspartate aminotransferase
VGWALGPAEVISKMKAINSHIGSWAPMAEQKAVANFLQDKEAVKDHLFHFKKEIEIRLSRIYSGFKHLRQLGYDVDAITPQAAIYLAVQINLVGKKTALGQILTSQEEVTSYILNEAKLALVPFYAFGADKKSDWYRLSVGCCKKEDIDLMLAKLGEALAALS